MMGIAKAAAIALMMLSGFFAWRACRLWRPPPRLGSRLSRRWHRDWQDPFSLLLGDLNLAATGGREFWYMVAAMLLTALAAARIGALAF
jgi:hypothetical protein